MATCGATLKAEGKSIHTAISAAGGSTGTTGATTASSRTNGEPSQLPPPTSARWFDGDGDNDDGDDDDDDVDKTNRFVSQSDEGMTSTV